MGDPFARLGRRMVRFQVDEQILTEMFGMPDGVWVEFVKSSDISPGVTVFAAGECFAPVEQGYEVPLVFPLMHLDTESGRVTMTFDTPTDEETEDA